ncbi:MAG: DUF3962 domain-containing protein [Jaaginema sp. PMC 1079.18]|nr:DUF3962 domain-containing protein [Jaaginema sp. PMC 1080.18]MEC4850656.1 DUF3962 domain-containing protein [Jaaginema sp. PMC 1079.18]MEC4866666.1 DUF3962 domain-containing protein [Jaaginema sp. PMC 1078.18]
MAYNTIFPGAWELTENVQYQLFSICVPPQWQQVAKSLARNRFQLQQSRYPSVPVYSIDSIIGVIFPQIVKTIRQGWERPGLPWILASERTDNLTDLALVVKDWLREEFECLGEDVDSYLDKLDDNLWKWETQPQAYSLLDKPKNRYHEVRFDAVPNYLAQMFVNINPTVTFGENNQYSLTFYPVARVSKGAELISWPPSTIPLIKRKEQKGTADISLVIRLTLQTVPWREQPLIYHQLSVRRWLTDPLKLPYRGATVYVGDTRRWLDGVYQPFCFMPLKMKRVDGEARWSRAIRELLSINDSPLVDPNLLLSTPNYNWSQFKTESEEIPLQGAIAYDSRHGDKMPCLPGVSPLDLASLDRALCDRIKQGFPLRRVGEGVKNKNVFTPFWLVQKDVDKGSRTNKNPEALSTPILRPSIAAKAVFSSTNVPLKTILILWETNECRDALINEICLMLSLSPKGEPKTYCTPNDGEGTQQIYQGTFGSICIQTQHVEDLTQNFNIDDPSVPGRNRQQRRLHLLSERIEKIKSFLPPTQAISGALVEIKPKAYIREEDPKLAWRIGAMQAGYLNQHIHKITGIKKSGETYFLGDRQERVKRAISDLFRQFAILPVPLIKPEQDKIDANLWLTCFYILRRTRKTTASQKPSMVVLMIRVNPLTGKVELTTPSLFQHKKFAKQSPWVSYPVGLSLLLYEKWDANYSFDEVTSETAEIPSSQEQKSEQQAINKFVTDCLRDCLNTSITKDSSPRVLLMAEAHNARKLMPWLRNPDLPNNDLPSFFKQQLSTSEQNRLWIVRLRTATDNEVPVSIVNSPGGRVTAGGVFLWQDVCDTETGELYLSNRGLLNTEQGTVILQKAQSRLDDGNKQAGNPSLLEIAIVHHPEIERVKLANFVHALRDRWPYFADEVSLPFPFPFAIKAKEYAVSARDSVEWGEESEEELSSGT